MTTAELLFCCWGNDNCGAQSESPLFLNYISLLSWPSFSSVIEVMTTVEPKARAHCFWNIFRANDNDWAALPLLRWWQLRSPKREPTVFELYSVIEVMTTAEPLFPYWGNDNVVPKARAHSFWIIFRYWANDNVWASLPLLREWQLWSPKQKPQLLNYMPLLRHWQLRNPKRAPTVFKLYSAIEVMTTIELLFRYWGNGKCGAQLESPLFLNGIPLLS